MIMLIHTMIPGRGNYFHHPAFDEYPVVGVNWKQSGSIL